jgi:GNAT acetyltransferase-like protein
VAVEQDGALLGGAPVVIERRAGFHWLHALPFVLPGAPLARAGGHPAVDRAVAGALAARARELGALGGEWSGYRPCGPPLDPALELVPGETRMIETSLLDLEGGIAAAHRRMDRVTRQELAAAARSGLAVAEEPAALHAAYALYRAQSRGWGVHGAVGLELSERLLEGGGGDPPARLFTVRDRRGLLSAALVLVGGREAMPWWSGTHPAGRARHAFALLLWSVAEWAAGRGLGRVNLGGSVGRAGVTAFKRALGGREHRYPVRWLGARHASALGRLVARAQAARRRGRVTGETV